MSVRSLPANVFQPLSTDHLMVARADNAGLDLRMHALLNTTTACEYVRGLQQCDHVLHVIP